MTEDDQPNTEATAYEKDRQAEEFFRDEPSPPSQEDYDSRPEPPSSFRTTVGKSTAWLSDAINEHLIVVRYGVVATVGLLAIYSASQTPLFFRYSKLSDIPRDAFLTRKRITGRLMKVITDDHHRRGVTCYIRHLSPAEQFLSKTWFDRLSSLYPSSASSSQRGWLKIQVAGIQYPSIIEEKSSDDDKTNSISSLISVKPLLYNEKEDQWLDRLAKRKTTVSCQLLGHSAVPNNNDQKPTTQRAKRPMPGFDHDNDTSDREQTAVVRLSYRPKLLQLFATDVAEYMVERGHAVVSDNGLFLDSTTQHVIDARIDNKRDVQYLDRLQKAEYTACAKSLGIWADLNYRESRPDVTEEADFRQHASTVHKLWRWLRGG